MENKIELIMELIKELSDSERIDLFGEFSKEFCEHCWGKCDGWCIDRDSWD